MSISVEEIMKRAPEGATHFSPYNDDFYKVDGQKYLYFIYGRSEWSIGDVIAPPSWIEQLVPVPKQPNPWSGPEDGLPPVGLEIEIKIDFKKAPPYAIVTLTELGVDVQKHTPRFQKAKVLYASSKYLVTEACGAEYLTPMSCVEIRAIRTAEKIAADKRETAIRELMDIAQADCRVTAARLVDAGFKREVK